MSKTNRLALLAFENDYCSQCYTERPVIKAIAEKFNNELDVQLINAQDERSIAQQYGVQSAPAVVLMKNGQVVEKIPHFIDQDQLETVIRYYR